MLGPVTGQERINTLDILRGIALLGILLMNIAGFGLVFPAYYDPTINGGAEGLNLYTWMTTTLLFEGTMRGLFSMLFGVGMVLMTSRMEERGGGIEVAEIYYRRTILLLIFGVIHGYLILWVGDILYAYGLFGLFLFPFRNTSPKKLIIVAIILTLAGQALHFYEYDQRMDNYHKFEKSASYDNKEDIPKEIKSGQGAWKGATKAMKPDEEEVQNRIDDMNQGYFDLILLMSEYVRNAETTRAYDSDIWDVLPMMLLGIVLYRYKVITGELSYRSYLIMMLIGYGIGLPVNIYEINLLMDNGFSLVSQLNADLTYNLGRIATTFGHVGLIMIFCKSGILRFLQKALASVGRMALTNYIMHSVICAFVFYGFGFGLYGQLQRYEIFYVVFAIWTLQLVVSPIWLKYFRFGPLEWAWRSLTYQKRQGFKRQQDPMVA